MSSCSKEIGVTEVRSGAVGVSPARVRQADERDWWSDGAEVRNHAGRTVGRAHLSSKERMSPEQIARLWAAAPNLVDIVRRLVAIADTGAWRDRAELSIAAHPAYDDARELLAAISKATSANAGEK